MYGNPTNAICSNAVEEAAAAAEAEAEGEEEAEAEEEDVEDEGNEGNEGKTCPIKSFTQCPLALTTNLRGCAGCAGGVGCVGCAFFAFFWVASTSAKRFLKERVPKK